MKRHLQLKHCLLGLIYLCIQGSLLGQDQMPLPDTTFSRDSLYHYWIKFPADTQTTCIRQIDARGLEFEEIGCDLLAIEVTNNTFSTSSDSSCYKTLRTYRIINWCEYNGQSAPVIVGRDWDTWNGTNPGRCSGAPRGNNRPGDTDLYVHVKRDFNDNEPDTVWYDADQDPYNKIPNDTLTEDIDEGYWWRVVSGSANQNVEEYYEGECSTWSYDNNASDSDIAGNIAADDSDARYGSFGYWIYTQHITVFDNVAPEVDVSDIDTFLSEDSDNCGAIVALPLTISDICSSNEPTITITLDIGNDGITDGESSILWDGNSFSGYFGFGEYRLIIEAFDNCGNKTNIEKIFHVADGVGPAPICQDRLVAEIEESGVDSIPPLARIWASDLIASNIFDCTGQSDSLTQAGNNLVTQFSINREGMTASPAQSSLSFFCGDQSNTPVPVEIHAWDEAGNNSFCTTEIIVQDNINTCSAPVDINGIIQTPEGKPFPNVEVRVSGGINFKVQTDEEGQYNLRLLRSTRDVSIQPSVDTDPSIGISTADLIRVQKHIIGREPFDSPYALLAADLDNNGRVNFMDIIRIRKTILGIEDPTLYNKNWLFIPANYEFSAPLAPWDESFPEKLVVDGGMNFNNYQTNFWAIKIGDANGSAIDKVETRSNQKAQLILPNLKLIAGQTYEIPIFLKDDQQFEGCQFALAWDTKAIEVLHTNTFSEQSLLHLDPKKGNHLKASWLNNEFSQKDKSIGSIQIRAKNNTDLNQVIALSDRHLTSEAYHSAFDTKALELNFQASTINWWSSENPFRISSTLQFSEDISGPLRVYDQSGRIVWQTVLNQNSQVNIRKTDLGAAGTYFFNVSHQGKVISGQLICID